MWKPFLEQSLETWEYKFHTTFGKQLLFFSHVIKSFSMNRGRNVGKILQQAKFPFSGNSPEQLAVNIYKWMPSCLFVFHFLRVQTPRVPGLPTLSPSGLISSHRGSQLGFPFAKFTIHPAMSCAFNHC